MYSFLLPYFEKEFRTQTNRTDSGGTLSYHLCFLFCHFHHRLQHPKAVPGTIGTQIPVMQLIQFSALVLSCSPPCPPSGDAVRVMSFLKLCFQPRTCKSSPSTVPEPSLSRCCTSQPRTVKGQTRPHLPPHPRKPNICLF